MRLICPNCDAQYEVDASAIPPAGRDVQCSNCGNAWFQEAESVGDDAAQETSDPVRKDIADTKVDPVVSVPGIGETSARLSEALPNSDNEDYDDEGAPPPSSLPKRNIDESILSVLREEAEREVDARRAEASGLEMQGDLGLPPPVSVAVGAAAAAGALPSETEKRLAAMKGEAIAPSRPVARRDLLPDIEEINSTLSPSADETSEPVNVDDLPDLTGGRKRRSGFRSGFVLMLLLAGLVTALYVMAPQISQQMPGAADTMSAYVAAVDAARIWLDGLIRQATGALNGLTSK